MAENERSVSSESELATRVAIVPTTPPAIDATPRASGGPRCRTASLATFMHRATLAMAVKPFLILNVANGFHEIIIRQYHLGTNEGMRHCFSSLVVELGAKA